MNCSKLLSPTKIYSYGKCLIVSNTSVHTFFYIFLAFYAVLKILNVMANSVDPDQTAHFRAV